jgi:serine/threonine protein kinase
VLILLLALAAVVIAVVLSKSRRRAPEEWSIDYEDLDFKVKLGQGGFGEVWRGEWKGGEVAIKILPSNVSKETLRDFESEVAVMSRLLHPNVVLFMAASIKPPAYCIVMEYMALGSLYDVRSPSSHPPFLPLPCFLLTRGL